jgi:hypothetical protein
MQRFFNTAGPIKPEMHYCLDPLKRFDLDDVLMLIAQNKYFVLHAPRQTGKTSTLLALTKYLNDSGQYDCVYANVEGAQAARNNLEMAMNNIMTEIHKRAGIFLGRDLDEFGFRDQVRSGDPSSALSSGLAKWATNSDKPIVLLLDEVDALVGDSLISLLRQVRSGYDSRPGNFPQSIILCGVRDVRDYRIHSGGEVITGGSAFNIKAKSLRMGDFIESEVRALITEHTKETGQAFTEEALDLLWHLTRGQPWLVNALAYEVCFEMKANRDRSRTITHEMIDEARENLIQRRETHLDQLNDKLREPRIRRVLLPLVMGQGTPSDIPDDDLMYTRDLGLIAQGKTVEIANPIYREIIPRQLTWTTQQTMTLETSWYVRKDGSLDMNGLLAGFQEFFREHSEHWIERFSWKEAGPQLLLQAFLQRIVNGGGRVEREYGLGRMRVDLLVVWPLHKAEQPETPWTRWSGPIQKGVIECKVVHGSLEATIAKGLEQTAAYLDRCGTEHGHLVIFDRDEKRTWEEKIFCKEKSYAGHRITVWGM